MPKHNNQERPKLYTSDKGSFIMLPANKVDELREHLRAHNVYTGDPQAAAGQSVAIQLAEASVLQRWPYGAGR
jgi:hypothetical protein